MVSGLIVQPSQSASVERKDARRISEAVRNRIWKIAFRNFAIACNEKAEETCKADKGAVPAAREAVDPAEVEALVEDLAADQ